MDVPATPGAYALVITLDAQFGELAQGVYLYAGSAWGPGGIRARVRRHLKREKPLHWHVDRLTTAGQVSGVIAVPGGRECAIVAAVAPIPGVTVPALGFGSSDCRVCSAHLLRLPDGLEPETIARALRIEGEEPEPRLIPVSTRPPFSDLLADGFDGTRRRENPK